MQWIVFWCIVAAVPPGWEHIATVDGGVYRIELAGPDHRIVVGAVVEVQRMRCQSLTVGEFVLYASYFSRTYSFTGQAIICSWRLRE